MCSSPWPHPTHGPTRCGQCMECRLAYSREWAIRMSHEQTLHRESCFLTLTYDDQHLPRFGQLVKRDLQLFLKRLRKLVGPVRYVACGEYGELRRRPHYHVALYGYSFLPDRVHYSEGIQGDPLYVSPTLARLWGNGALECQLIGSLTFESSAYIARYITKRIGGVGASPLPLAVDPDTGECVMPEPEFLLCSRKPGIGFGWYERYFDSDVLPHGRVITAQGTPAPVPRYYKKLLADANPWFKNLGNPLNKDKSSLMALTAANFDKQTAKLAVENRPERRAARTVYAQARTGIFKRDLKDK